MKYDLFQHPKLKDIYLTKKGEVFRRLPLSCGSGGYHSTKIEGKLTRRHVLVAETFIGCRRPGMVVRHKDGDPSNDLPSNLEWGTQAENIADTVRHGKTTVGEKNARSLLTDAAVRDIKQRLLDGESGVSIALDYGVSQPTISNIKTGTTWSHI